MRAGKYNPQNILAKTPDGKIVSILDVKKLNIQSDFSCPCCNKKLRTRAMDSEHMQPHFAHMPNESCIDYEALRSSERKDVFYKREMEFTEKEVENYKDRVEGLEYIYQFLKRAKKEPLSEDGKYEFFTALDSLEYDDQVFVYTYTKNVSCMKEIQSEIADRVNQNALNILEQQCPGCRISNAISYKGYNNYDGKIKSDEIDVYWHSHHISVGNGRVDNRVIHLSPTGLHNIQVKLPEAYRKFEMKAIKEYLDGNRDKLDSYYCSEENNRSDRYNELTQSSCGFIYPDKNHLCLSLPKDFSVSSGLFSKDGKVSYAKLLKQFPRGTFLSPEIESKPFFDKFVNLLDQSGVKQAANDTSFARKEYSFYINCYSYASRHFGPVHICCHDDEHEYGDPDYSFDFKKVDPQCYRNIRVYMDDSLVGPLSYDYKKQEYDDKMYYDVSLAGVNDVGHFREKIAEAGNKLLTMYGLPSMHAHSSSEFFNGISKLDDSVYQSYHYTYFDKQMDKNDIRDQFSKYISQINEELDKKHQMDGKTTDARELPSESIDIEISEKSTKDDPYLP